MSLTFYTIQLIRCSEETAKKLQWLTLDGESQMRHAIYTKSPHNTAIILKDSDKQIIGWCLIQKRYHNKLNKYAIIQLFIKSEFRRHGLGSELVTRAIRYIKRDGCKEATAAPWNTESRKFFKSLGFKKETHKHWRKNV